MMLLRAQLSHTRKALSSYPVALLSAHAYEVDELVGHINQARRTD